MSFYVILFFYGCFFTMLLALGAFPLSKYRENRLVKTKKIDRITLPKQLSKRLRPFEFEENFIKSHQLEQPSSEFFL